MKIPHHLKSFTNLNTNMTSDNVNTHHPILPAVWGSVGRSEWGNGRSVILIDSDVCTRPGDHVTCLPSGVCHATTHSSTVDGCRVHVNDTGAWGSPSCPRPLPAEDVAHATALWDDFNTSYTGRRN
ncbi:MAG: hypothetical protein ACFHVJ_08545 [Aestuariibacter sp.]